MLTISRTTGHQICVASNSFALIPCTAEASCASSGFGTDSKLGPAKESRKYPGGAGATRRNGIARALVDPAFKLSAELH